jgi:hypothetical protein
MLADDEQTASGFGFLQAAEAGWNLVRDEPDRGSFLAAPLRAERRWNGALQTCEAATRIGLLRAVESVTRSSRLAAPIQTKAI